MFVYGKNIQKYVCQNALAVLRGPNTRILKVSFGSLRQSADYNFGLESLILLSSGWLNPTCDTRIIHFYYARAALTWIKEKPKNQQQQRTQRNEKLKANSASETKDQRKEMLRIRRKKDIVGRRTKKTTRRKERVIRNRRPRETAPGHSQKIEVR